MLLRAALGSIRRMTTAATTTDYVVCWVTHPPANVGTFATKVVESKLAACVNVIPKIQSVYTWEGKVENDEEALCMIKTRRALVPELTTFVQANHPYDCPEVIAAEIVGGAPAYLEWVAANTKAPGAPAVTAAAAAPAAAQEGGAADDK